MSVPNYICEKCQPHPGWHGELRKFCLFLACPTHGTVWHWPTDRTTKLDKPARKKKR